MDEPAAADAAAADAARAAPGGGEEAAPTAKKELFTLQVNVTGAETEGGVVPLTLHEGEAPGEVAAAFARANGLPDVSRDELTVAILQYAKQNGFVTPAFSIPITLPPAEGATEGETATLDWFPGDQASSVAADFAVKHNLDGTQRLQLVRGLIKEARVRGLVQPIFTLNVALPLDEGATEGTEPKRVPLDIYDGDDLDDAASEFVTRHSLPDVYRAQIRQGLRARAKTMELIKPVFELGVTLLSGAREVLKVYDGDNVESVAIDFAQTHDLAHDEREALIAAVEEQASARKLLPPLLFKLPVKVGDQKDPWIAQLYVHQGDVPAQIAASFVRQRHLPARPPSSCDATIAWLLLQLFRAHQPMRGRWASTPGSRHTHVSVPVPSCPRVHQVSRYSGWGNATETVQTITAAIVAKAGTINEAIEDAATRKEGQAEGATAAGV
jgi:hypothetical protein